MFDSTLRTILLVPILFLSTASDCVPNVLDFLSSKAFTGRNQSALNFDTLLFVNTARDKILVQQQFLWKSGSGSVSVITMSDMNNSLARLANGNEDNQIQNITRTPTVFLFPCILTSLELLDTLNQLTLYYQSDFKARNWRPVFILLNPVSNSSAASQQTANPAINDTEILKVALNFSIDTDIYVLHQILNLTTVNITGPGSRSNSSATISQWLLKEYYSIRNQTIVHEVAHLNSLRAMDITSVVQGKTKRRSNFEGAAVIAVGHDDLDYPLATKFKPGTLELESGFEVSILRYFRDALNFSEQAIKSVGYIREAADGHLSGAAVQLKVDGDIAIGAAEFLEYRVKGPDGITYLHPMFYANIYAYFKQPPSSSVRNIFTQTFTTGLWIAALGLWAFIVAVLKLSVRVKSGRPGFQNIYEDEVIAGDGVVWATGVICQQGWHMSPSSGPTRIIFLTGIFTGLILFVAYSAALVSILSVEVVPIQSFLDLLRENFFILSDGHIPTAKFVVKGLEDSKQIPNLGEAVRNVEVGENLQKLIKTRCAVVTISDSFYPIVQQANFTEEFICKTISVQPVGGRPLKESCVVRRGSPLREWLNQKMIQMQERGVREKMIKDYVLDTSVQCLQSGSVFHDQLGMRDVFTAYLILAAGIALGCFVAAIEKCFAMKHSKSK